MTYFRNVWCGLNLNEPVLDDGVVPKDEVDIVEVEVWLARVVDVLGLDRGRPKNELYCCQNGATPLSKAIFGKAGFLRCSQ